jgi:Zn finger protein HypA/HybF involved in hydrogenase expression
MTILSTTIYYPVYCRNCQYYWYVKNREGLETCPRCGSGEYK